MRMSNKPTRGTPLTDEERAEGDRLRRSSSQWFGGPRFQTVKGYGKANQGNSRPKRERRMRSDYTGGNVQRRK